MIPAVLVVLSFHATTAFAQAVGQAVANSRYTHHPQVGGPPRIIVLSLEGPFTHDEEANVRRAIEEWNHVLNGSIRFDVVSAGGGSTTSWSLQAQKGGTPQAPDPAAGQPLSSTQSGFLGIGGRMVIYVDRIGKRDLRGIALHELGHVLGLNHDHGRLMSARYQPTTDQCVDYATAAIVATRHKLPIASLNWCDDEIPRTR